LRFAFYGRVSTEDWQDPDSSRARQREQATALVRGHGQVVADFFDIGQSRTLTGAEQGTRWACGLLLLRLNRRASTKPISADLIGFARDR
jgi:hypothetical protein